MTLRSKRLLVVTLIVIVAAFVILWNWRLTRGAA